MASKAVAECPAAQPVLHYVARALPVERGASIRTHGVATGLSRRGIRAAVLTRPRASHAAGAASAEIDGVTYLDGSRIEGADGGMTGALLRAVGARHAARSVRLRALAGVVERNLGTPSVVHAHGGALVARDAAILARWLGVPCVQEVRGFEALSRAARDGTRPNVGEIARRTARAVAGAAHVVAICGGIADRLVEAGVPRARLSIVPNGVDTSRFAPRARDPELVRRHGLAGRTVFGCATNVRRLEGLDGVVRAWPKVLSRLPDAVFVVVGDGEASAELRRAARDAGLGETVRFVGRVPWREMPAWYALFDVFVTPRVAEPVCEIVTPSKPLEAMACGVPVLASDLPALRELVDDGRTGLLFRPGDADSLAEACATLGRDAVLRDRLADAALAQVRRERDWKLLAERYETIYAGVAAAAPAGVAARYALPDARSR